MKTLVLGKDQFKKDGCYNEYIGTEDLSDFQGHLEIEADLGWTLFAHIRVSGYILAKSGSGISAGEGISAGDGISAGSGISAGWGISAGSGISAGWGISAGDGISAGEGISAGDGISAGLTIICKKVLKFRFQIFAGVCRWKKTNDEDKKIQCLRLEGGEVAYGILEESKKENK